MVVVDGYKQKNPLDFVIEGMGFAMLLALTK